MLGLVIEFPPLADEGLPGYLLRLAKANHVEGSRVMDRFKALSDDSASCLPEEMRIAWTGIFHLLRQPSTERAALWNARTRRYCPHCLAELCYWRAKWDLSLMTTCTIHGCPLIDTCRHCERSHSWRDPSLDQCGGCGAAFAAQNHDCINVDSEGQWLAQQLECRLVPTAPKEGCPLNKHDLKQFHDLVTCLGVRRERRHRSKPMLVGDFHALRVIRPIVKAAEQTLMDWPRGFFSLLDELRTETKEHRWRISRTFGALYRDIYKRLGDPHNEFLRVSLEAYMAEHWLGTLTARNRRLSRALVDEHSWVPIATAVERCGIDRSLILKMIAMEEIPHRRQELPSGRTATVVDLRQLKQREKQLKEVIGQQDLAQLLGLPVTRVHQMLDAGQLSVIGGRPGPRQPWKICRGIVHQLAEIGEGLPLRATQNEEEKTLHEALRYCHAGANRVVKLLRQLINQEIRAVGRMGEPHEIGAWLLASAQRAQLQREVEVEGFISIVASAQILNVKEEVAYALVRHGLIDCVTMPVGRQETRMISRQALISFRERYVLGTELAIQLSISPKMLASRLRAQGLLPVAGPGMENRHCRQNVWQRSPALDLYVEQLKEEKRQRGEQQGSIPDYTSLTHLVCASQSSG